MVYRNHLSLLPIVIACLGSARLSHGEGNGCIKDFGKPNITKKVIECYHPAAYRPDKSQLCKAGLVRDVRASFIDFNVKTRKFKALVTWKPTLFGLENLWGYSIHYFPLQPGHALPKCKQILDKRTSIVLDNFWPGAKYKFVVLSLPRHDFNKSEGKSTTATSEGLCITLKKMNASLALRCLSPTLKMENYNCKDGTITMQWNGIPRSKFKRYLLEWKAENDKDVTYAIFNSTVTRYTLSGLKPVKEYQIKVLAWRDFGDTSRESNTLTFSCLVPPRNVTVVSRCEENKAKVIWGKPHHQGFDTYLVEWKKLGQPKWEGRTVKKSQSQYSIEKLDQDIEYSIRVRLKRGAKMSNGSYEFQYICKGPNYHQYIIISIVLSVAFLVMVVVATICCRLRRKIWNQRYSIPLTEKDPLVKVEERGGPEVIVFLPPGCKYVEHVSVHLVNLLRELNIAALSIMNEKNLIRDIGGANYITQKFKSVDFVILLHSQAMDSFQNINKDPLVQVYQTAVDICCNQTIKPRIISLYFNLRNGLKMFGDYSVSTYKDVPLMLSHSWSYKCPKDIPEIAERILSSGKLKGKTMELNEVLLDKIRRLTAVILWDTHKSCRKDDCHKGEIEDPEIDPDDCSNSIDEERDAMSSADSMEEIKLGTRVDSGFQDEDSCSSQEPSTSKSNRGEGDELCQDSARNSMNNEKVDEPVEDLWVPQDVCYKRLLSTSSMNSDAQSMPVIPNNAGHIGFQPNKNTQEHLSPGKYCRLISASSVESSV